MNILCHHLSACGFTFLHSCEGVLGMEIPLFWFANLCIYFGWMGVRHGNGVKNMTRDGYGWATGYYPLYLP
jgi:hypothetical protein